MDALFLALVLLLVGGVVPLVFKHWFTVAKGLHIALLALGAVCGIYALFAPGVLPNAAGIELNWLYVFSFSLRVDALTRIFLLPIFLLAPILGLYGYDYLDQPEHSLRSVVSQFFFSLLLIAMVLVTMAANMLTFALAWELMSLSSFFLVIVDWERQEVQEAAVRYLLFTQAGALCVFAAFGVVYTTTGSLAFGSWEGLSHGVKVLAFFLGLAGFGSKAGIIPLHIWLPHAHPAAPSHVSALMSGVMIKMGIYGILRFYLLLAEPAPIFAWIVLLLGITSGVLGVAYALAQKDIKRLLAYSSIENIGIILIGCGLGMLGLSAGNSTMALFGFAGAMVHLLNHALFKSLLFLGAGAVLHATGTRNMDRLGGLMKSMPVTGKNVLLGSVAIAGLPPLNGFVGEFLIYFAAFQGLVLRGTSLLFAVAALLALALIGGLACACFTKMVGVTFLGEPRYPLQHPPHEAGPSMRLAMILLSLGCLLVGLWPEPLIRFVAAGISGFAADGMATGTLRSVSHSLALAARIALAGLIAVALLRRLLYRGKTIEENATWGCGFTQGTARIQYTGTSYARSMVDFHHPLVGVDNQAKAISNIFPQSALYTSKVRDLAEQGLQRLFLDPLFALVERMRWIQHGHIQLYIAYIVLTIAVLLLVIAY
ncbi:MAG: proton-conducting transporter membrane subunit [Desulfobulbus sp.]|nr:proton-conducting transporter membrane subunit [Desulfobulbus sp.]